MSASHRGNARRATTPITLITTRGQGQAEMWAGRELDQFLEDNNLESRGGVCNGMVAMCQKAYQKM